MDPKVVKLQERALEFLEERRFDRAIETFQELTQVDGKNPRWWHKLGEAHQRAGEQEEAIEAFRQAAWRAAQTGQLLKAIALCKLVLNLDPGHREIQSMLAILYSKRNTGIAAVEQATSGAPWEQAAAPPASSEDEDEDAPRHSFEDPPEGLEPLAESEPAIFESIKEIDFDPDAPAPEPTPPPRSKTEETDWLDSSRAAEGARPEPVPEAISMEIRVEPVEEGESYGGEEVEELFDPGLRELPSAPALQERPLGGLQQHPEIAPGESLDSIELQRLMAEMEASIRDEGDAEQGESVVMEIDLGTDEELDEDVGREGQEEPPVPPSVTEIIEQMPPTPLFSSLGRDALQMLIERVHVCSFDPGDRLVEEGQRGDSLFVIVEGRVRAFREGPPGVELGEFGEGDFFGEISLITETVRAATVEAVEEGIALEVSRDVINGVVAEHPAVLKELLRFFRMRMIEVLVRTHELFQPFAGEDHETLERRFAFLEAREDASLITEGEPSDGLYILLSGRAEVSMEGDPVGELRPGDLVGEPSLLSGKPSAITVRTTVKCWLLKLDRPTFVEMILNHPAISSTVTGLAEQSREQQALLQQGGGFEAFSLTLF